MSGFTSNPAPAPPGFSSAFGASPPPAGYTPTDDDEAHRYGFTKVRLTDGRVRYCFAVDARELEEVGSGIIEPWPEFAGTQPRVPVRGAAALAREAQGRGADEDDR